MLELAPLAFDVSKLLATFANVMPKKLHLQLKVIQAQATAVAEPSSCRNEKSQAGLYETIGRGPFTAKQWPKTFLASAKMYMQCASLSPTSSLTLSFSLSLCHPPAKLCNKKTSFLRDTRHVAIALLLWPCCVLPAVPLLFSI